MSQLPILLQPKHTHAYRVTFKGFGTDTHAEALMSQVEAVSRPTARWAAFKSTVQHGASRITLRDDVHNIVASEIDAQFARQANGDDFSCSIETFDPREETVLDRVVLYNCQLVEAVWSVLDYSPVGLVNMVSKVTITVEPKSVHYQGAVLAR